MRQDLVICSAENCTNQVDIEFGRNIQRKKKYCSRRCCQKEWVRKNNKKSQVDVMVNNASM